MIQALLRANGDPLQAYELMRGRRDTPHVAEYLKSAVAPGTTTGPDWASPLYQAIVGEFIDLLRPATIIGRLSGVAAAPFNVRLPRATSGSSASWVGENTPKPVSAMALDKIEPLAPLKISTICALSKDLVKLSTPSAEATVNRDMVAGTSAFMDKSFIDASMTAVAGVSPASITSGVTPIASTGSSYAQVNADVRAAFAPGIDAGLTYASGAWIMNPRTALFLSGVVTAGGALAFPGISIQGGVFYGLPVLCSASVPIDTSGNTIIALLDAANILLAQGAILFDVSQEATLQMLDNPASGSTTLTSLWQNNLVGLRVEMYANWAPRHAAAVAVIAGVSY